MVANNVLTQTVGQSSNLCEVSGSRTGSLAGKNDFWQNEVITSSNGLCEHFCAFTSAACSSE